MSVKLPYALQRIKPWVFSVVPSGPDSWNSQVELKMFSAHFLTQQLRPASAGVVSTQQQHSALERISSLKSIIIGFLTFFLFFALGVRRIQPTIFQHETKVAWLCSLKLRLLDLIIPISFTFFSFHSMMFVSVMFCFISSTEKQLKFLCVDCGPLDDWTGIRQQPFSVFYMSDFHTYSVIVCNWWDEALVSMSVYVRP